MSHPFGTLHLITNPRSGNGAVRKTMPKLREALEEHKVGYEVHQTKRAGHATDLARDLASSGERYIGAVGGDGTVHEVVNGLMADQDTPIRDDLVLAPIAAGSGSDFVRTFGLTTPLHILVKRHLATEATMGLDLGRVWFTDAKGVERMRFFANIAEVGWGADVVRRAAKLPRFVGRVRYLVSAWAAVRSANPQPVSLKLDKTTADINMVELVVANGQFFGGGMKVAPRALPDDGLFNVLAFTGGKAQVFTMTPKIYSGDHLPNPKIAEWQSATAAVAPADPMLVEADGEVLGHTPVRFDILPTPLQLKN